MVVVKDRKKLEEEDVKEEKKKNTTNGELKTLKYKNNLEVAILYTS